MSLPGDVLPTGSDETINIDTSALAGTDFTYNFSQADFAFRGGSGYQFDGITIWSVNTTSGTLTLDGNAVTVNEFIAAGDLSKLVYTPSNAGGADAADFTYRLMTHDAFGQFSINVSYTTTVNVLPINDAPIGADKTITMLEDGSYAFSASDFGFSDPADGVQQNGFLRIFIASGDIHGTLLFNGEPFNPDTDRAISVADLGKLTFQPSANDTGAGKLILNVFLVDDGGTANGGLDTSTKTYAITLDVQSVNDAPTGAENTVTIIEGGSHAFSMADFGFSDAADGDQANSFKSIFIAGGDYSGTLMYDGRAWNPDTDRTIAVADLDKLSFQPGSNASGTGELTLDVYLTDNGGTANGGQDTSAISYTFTIDVQSVNNAPSGADKTVTVLEDSGKFALDASMFSFADPIDTDAPNALKHVIIDAISGKGKFMLGQTEIHAGDVVTAAELADFAFQSAKNAHGDGYAGLTFRLADDGGTENGGADTETNDHTLTFNISPVNDAPVGATKRLTFTEDSGQHKLGASAFGFSDPNDASDPNVLSKVIIDKVIGKGEFLLGKTEVHAGDIIGAVALEKLTFHSGKNEFGDAYAKLQYRLVDDGGTASGGADTEASDHTLKIGVTDAVDRFTGKSGNDILKGTAGHDILDGKAGSDRLAGGGGSDTFVFGTGYGKDVISDFDVKGADHDVLDLRKLSGFDSFADIRDHAHAQGSDLVIVGDTGEQITLMHIKLSSLSAADFML